jgi:hypothetical protein
MLPSVKDVAQATLNYCGGDVDLITRLKKETVSEDQFILYWTIYLKVRHETI